jgi:hypothetical protein
VDKTCKGSNLLRSEGGVIRLPFLVKGELVVPPVASREQISSLFSGADKSATYARLPHAQLVREPVIDRKTMKYTGEYIYQVMPQVNARELVETDFDKLAGELYDLTVEEILKYVEALLSTLVKNRRLVKQVFETSRLTSEFPDHFLDRWITSFCSVFNRQTARQMIDAELSFQGRPGSDFLNGWVEMPAPASKDGIVLFSGSSGAAVREKVIKNFDERARYPENKYRILITTEVLSEGVNLHRSNVVINYDIPWNPTRLMQRVGRINRVDTKFDKVYNFTFFPTQQSNDEIRLREAAEAKIHAFLTLLGDDAQILTEGEPVGSHELFNRLISKKTITGEDGDEVSELKYLHLIKEIRDKNPDLFNKIKRVPKKARTARASLEIGNALVTYFRKGKLQKFFLARLEQEAKELDFMTAAQFFEAESKTARKRIGKDYYDLLEQNKEAFFYSTAEEQPAAKGRGGRDASTQIFKILKALTDLRQLTEEQEEYLARVRKQLEEGGLTKQTTKRTLQALQKEIKENGFNPLRVLGILQTHIPSALLEGHIAESAAQTFGPHEVILSEYFSGK